MATSYVYFNSCTALNLSYNFPPGSSSGQKSITISGDYTNQQAFWVGRWGGYSDYATYDNLCTFSIGSAVFTLTVRVQVTRWSTYLSYQLGMSNPGQNQDTQMQNDWNSHSFNFSIINATGEILTYNINMQAFYDASTTYADVYVTITNPSYTSNNPKWSFGKTVDVPRAIKLLTPQTTQTLIKNLSENIIPYGTTPYAVEKHSKQTWKRPVFYLSVSNDYFDYFINSPFGYRAQYVLGAIPPSEGTAFNSAVLQGISDNLLKIFSEEINAKEESLTSQLVEDCLGFTQAKIWLDEATSSPDVLDNSWLDNANVTILYQPWINSMTDSQKGFKGIWGVQAYSGQVLVVKGGWVDPQTQKEAIEPSKKNRSLEIQHYGFS